MLLPFAAVASLFVGGVGGAIWQKINPRSAAAYLIPLASGFIAGEAMIAVIVPLLLALHIGRG